MCIVKKVEKLNCAKCEKKCKRSDAKYCSRNCAATNRLGLKNGPFWQIASIEKTTKRLKEKFECMVIKAGENSCWGWKNKLDNGYGIIKTGKSAIRSHRVSWIIHYGIIPDHAYICHSCDNRECTNPRHLFLGDHKSNMSDMVEKGRNRWKNFKEKMNILNNVKK